MMGRSSTWILAAAVGAALLPVSGSAQRARTDRHVVLISIDGFAADYLVNPRVPLPNLHRMAEEGAQAEAMMVATPSVTWPNHTTLVTGVYPAKHGVLANGLIEPATVGPPMAINPRRTKEELCRFPTVYDLASEAGMVTAEVNWPVTRGAKTLNYSFPDHPEPLRYTTAAILDHLKTIWLLPQATDAAFSALGPVSRDQVWSQTAAHLIRTRKPNLLMLHLLFTDGIQHRRGPNTDEAYAALALSDRHVGDILQALRDAGLRDRSSVVVTADHGFSRVTRSLQPNVRLHKAGLIRPAEAGKAAEYDAWTVPEGGTALVYVPKGRLNPELLDQTRRALEEMEGVEKIMPPAEYTQLGIPERSRNPQAPDFLISAKDGYAFGGGQTGEEVVQQVDPTGSHGYVHTNPKMDGIFVASGAGIRKGVKLQRIKNVDVAPTIARLLGLTVRDVDGRALEEILVP